MFVTTILAKIRTDLRYRETLRELSQLSDRELDDFFDYWVEGGFIPTLTLAFAREQTLEGELLTGPVTSSGACISRSRPSTRSST